MKWIVCISLALLCVSCSSPVEQPKEERQPEKLVSRDDAVSSLPCFRCHSHTRFSSRTKGVFPHKLHKDTGYHCNQCHPFKGHEHMKINEAICKDCHGLTTFTIAASGFPTKFDHGFHAKLGCKECHLGIFQMKRGSSRMSMDDIYQGRYCGTCHNGKKAFASTECSRCHDLKNFAQDVSYKVEGIGDVVFSHRFHTSVFSCNDCHTKIFAMRKTHGKMAMNDMYQGKHCGACHNGTAASPVSECKNCHKPK